MPTSALKAIVDSVFEALEVATANRPVIHLLIATLHSLAASDAVLGLIGSKVQAKTSIEIKD